MIPRAFWQYVAAFYFAFQTVCATIWWGLIWLEPRLRPLFRPQQLPDSTLFALFLPDAVLFLGMGAWSALLLLQNPARARVPLALHIGASLYAALFCVGQTLLSGEARDAAILMTLCASCGAFLGWKAVGSD